MAFNEQGFIQAARAAGYSDQEIGQAVGSRRTGLSKWLLGNRTSLPGKAFEAVSNVLNLPSYAIGGLINKVQGATGSQYAQGDTGKSATGIIEGIKNKRAVFSELPESLNVDPNSTLGMGIGFVGELATPNVPLGKAFSFVAKGARGLDAASNLGLFNRFAKGAEKIGGVADDAGRTLLMKSYKLSASDINKLADALGVTKEADKVPKVLEYLEGMGLSGSHAGSLKKLDEVTDLAQEAYDSMTKSGRQISRIAYAKALEKQAQELAATAGDPRTRTIVNGLLDEAKQQRVLAKQGVSMTDEFLTNTKTRAFTAASDEAINNPYSASLNEQIGRAGVNTLEEYAPGSKNIGTKLRGYRTTQNVVGAKARTGLGTQLINAMKPGAVGFGLGAGVGYARGEDPLKSGIIGGFATTVANNPRVLNAAGKIASRKIGFSPAVSKGIQYGMKVNERIPGTVLRLSGASSRGQANGQQHTQLPVQLPQGSTPPAALPLLQQTPSASYVQLPQSERLQGSGSLFNPYKRVRLR